jgi:hypothetical protein
MEENLKGTAQLDHELKRVALVSLLGRNGRYIPV